MTNLKKTIAVVLAFAMIFSMGMISTFAYSDVEASTTVGEAVGILSNLGILTGFEDGTFKPDETVTRAQMAAIVCRTLGYESQAKSSAGSTIFNDVPGDHWAAGYINVAQSLNIINGYGDGNFGPEDKVTYEQAVKMIVCALNYDLVAQAKGGYPTGYLSVASSEGITKSANGKVGDAAKRSTVAVLVYNSLEVRILDQNTWTTDGSDEYAKSDDTILSKYLEVNKWEGVVSDVPFTDYAKNDYKKNTTPKISLDGNAFYKVYKNGKETKIEDEAATNVDCSLVDVEGLLGKKVIAYIGDSEDDETGNIMVYAISEKSSGNTVTKISKTQLVDKDDKEFTIQDQISYRKTGSTKVYDLDLDSKVKIYKNYEVDAFDTATSTNETTAGEKMNNTEGLDQLVGQGGTIELISNDNDDDIEYIVINAYTDEGTIESVSEEEGEITFTLYNGGLDDIDTADEDVLVKVYRDGELAAAKDLAAGDTVSTVEISKSVRVLYASSKTVTGSVDSYDTEDKTVTIAGNDYELSPFKSGTVASLKDEEGTFYLNVDGQIAHNESDSAASGNYGFVIAVDKETGINDGYVMQVVLADGTVAEYDLASKAKYYDKNGTSVTTDDKTTAEAIAKIIGGSSATLGSSAVKATAKNIAKKADNGVFKFTIKDGKINKIKALKGEAISYLEANTKKYDAEAMSYGSAEFDKNTVVFAIDAKTDSTAEIKDDDVSVGEVSAFFADEDDALTFVALDQDNGIVGVVLGFDLKTSVPEDSAAVIIESIKTVTYDDDDAVQITGLQGGKEVTYTIYDEDADYASSVAPEDLAKGDVILIAAANSENVVSDFKTLYQANKSGALGTVDADAKKGDDKDDIYNAVANLDAAKTKDSNNKFYLDAAVANDYDTFAAKDDGLSMRASANYTLVDYTESTKNPTVEKKSSSTTLSTSAKYKTVVFVRVYDGVLAEVVAYRFNA